MLACLQARGRDHKSAHASTHQIWQQTKTAASAPVSQGSIASAVTQADTHLADTAAALLACEGVALAPTAQGQGVGASQAGSACTYACLEGVPHSV